MKKLLASLLAFFLTISLASAQQVPISQLPSGGTILNTDLIPIVRSGVTMRGTLPATGSGTVTSVTFTGDGTVLSSTPSSAVTTAGTLTSTLANQTANTVLGALTATRPSDLAVPSCSTSASALQWTSGTGFGCNTSIAAGSVQSLVAAGTNMLLTGSGTASSPYTLGSATVAGGFSTNKVSLLYPFYIYPTGTPLTSLVSLMQQYPAVPTYVVLNPDSGPGATVTATASFTTSSTTIAVPSGQSSIIVSGFPVYDVTSGHVIGTVSSYSGTTLTLTAAALYASTGSADVLNFANTDYLNAMASLTAANGYIAAYVPTGYGIANHDYSGQNQAAIESQMLQWRAMYPLATTMFMDEMDNTGSSSGCTSLAGGNCITLYENLTAYAHSIGFTLVMGNPGDPTVAGYIGVPASDVMSTYESTSYPTAQQASGSGLGTTPTRGCIVYDVSYTAASFTTMMQNCSFVFATDSTNYTVAPSYLATEFLALYAQDIGNPLNNANETTISFSPYYVTALNTTKGGFIKFVKSATVDNIEVSANQFTCSGNPTITLYECGTSTTCASSPVTIGSGTIAAAGTVVNGTVSNATITAGDYVAWEISAGTCTLLNAEATAQIHTN